MFRVLLAIGGTIAGLVALLSFKSHSGAASPAAASNTGLSATAPPSAGTGSALGGTGSAASGSSSAAPHTGTSSGSEVLTGNVIETKFGPMQVQVTLVNHKIVKVTVLQQTDLGAFSPSIDARAIPKLNQEALTAQSAHIQAVSGASYTSAGYIQSLQSALDKA